MKIIILIIMFFCIGAFFILSQNNLSLNSSENIDEFISLYTAWINKNLNNIGTLTGYIVKLDWLPKNSTKN